MEITKENFPKKLDEIIDAIKKATFIAVDTEFTGLLTDDRLKRSYFDSGADVYVKERENLKNVTICQLGISAIKSCIDKNGYEAKTYNFYIMPKALLSVDPSITCQSSSVEFLMQAGFDFREWLLNGIPCLNEEDEQTIRKEFKYMLTDDYNQCVPYLVLDQLAIVDAWRQQAADGDKQLSVFLRLPSFILHFLAAIFRRYTDVSVTLELDEVKLLYIGEGSSREELLGVIENAFESIISENRGFVQIFKHITRDKILILHNGMTDLTLMFKQFYRSLPENYNEFKNDLHEMFPDIYDTKRIARIIGQQFKKHKNSIKSMNNLLVNSSLEAIKLELDSCKWIQHRPIVSHSSLTPKYGGSKLFFHEAGYDAFCTAYCFVNLAHVYQVLQDEDNKISPRPLSSLEHVGAVSPWRNEIPLQQGGISYVVIGGENPAMNSMNWIVMQNRKMFGPLATSQINKLLAPFGRFEAQRLHNGAFLIATFRKRSIMEAFRNNDFVHVAHYSPMKHSPNLRKVTWSAVLFSSGISVLLMAETIKILNKEIIPLFNRA